VLEKCKEDMREGEDPLDVVAFSFAGGGHKGN
jgi:hypothetical protein